MAYRRSRSRSRGNYSRRRSSYGRRRASGRRSYNRGGGKTVRIVVEQAAPTGSILPAPNASTQMASRRSMF